MRQRFSQSGFTLLEFIAVIVMIGILMATSLRYYADIVDDARVAGVQYLSNRFAAAVAGVHLKWTVDGRPASVELDGVNLRLNKKGWPTGVQMNSTANSGSTVNVCRQLWESLLQNPAYLPEVLPNDTRGVQYWAGKPENGVCRYNLISRDSGKYYFEYYMKNGRVRSVTDRLD